MRDRSTEPVDPNLPVGKRIQYYRTKRGMSCEVLGGLVGKTGRWVRAVESGRLQTPKLPVLLAIAEALKIRDLGQLLGGQPMPTSTFRGPGHPALPAVRDAINAIGVPDTAPPRLDHLAARVAAAWRARHAAPDHRTVLGGLLPELIRDARHAAYAYGGDDRRRALALLAEVYNLTQFFVAYQPDSGLLWRVAERALLTAQEAEEPRTIGGAVWLLAEAHRDAGDLDAAEQVIRDGMELLRPRLEQGGDDLRAMWGALHAAAAYTAARAGQKGTAWGWWDRAEEIARSLSADHYDPLTSFSRVVMGAHAVTLAVELRQSGESRRQAARHAAAAIPSQPRRGRHLVEVARAWQTAGDHAAAVDALADGYATAPETIRFNGYARQMITEYAGKPGPLRAPARDLAERVGLLV
ncbi:helix-turn-helix domain-containing protein [Thermomonospora curvata]|uniref:Transcriptional regulator, XRE family n=1 Tax=Thermomonospora curvata (strain ATCC 19995 / DSM 43183 / JCM 3096 / KCTC 9072 / NBRC 15933 / NCIMB 10081 / Henssen B9) TaxID=471852 RepID=D1A3M8_THECD|nr:helix-turn-helix domain-containing protein [Thermomonospora curvata]ACY96153.1 transcriptional regulator, XRE family [Thermomonospora curvata DSM 43183]